MATVRANFNLVPPLCNPVLELTFALALLASLVCELPAPLAVLGEPPTNAVDVTVDPSMEGVVVAPLNEVDSVLEAPVAGAVTTMVDVIADPAALVLVVMIMLVALGDDSNGNVELSTEDELTPEVELLVED